jgi:mannose-6-phosphate isomerase class I
LEKGQDYFSESKSPEIFLVINGKVQCENLICKRGEAFVVLPDNNYTIRGVENAVLYKAFVPLQ